MTDSFSVVKFGGSSVRDADGILECIDLLNNIEDVLLVVVSATYNTTNLLEESVELCLKNKKKDSCDLLRHIENHHLNIAKDLSLYDSTLSEITQLIDEAINTVKSYNSDHCSEGKISDEISSFGERLSSLLFFERLKITHTGNVRHLDARKVIVTDNNFRSANPFLDKIKIKVKSEVSLDGSIYVTGGFIGSTEKGEATTLGREGSDFTATLLGEAVGASCVYICTDVPGIATIDPRLFDGAKFIKELSYTQAHYMALMGAKILFRRTLEPIMRREGLLKVISTRTGEGTLIKKIDHISSTPCGMSFSDEGMLSIIGDKGEWVARVSSILQQNYLLQHDCYTTWKITKEKLIVCIEDIHDYLFKPK